MKTLLPIVLAAVLAAPVQADDCSDFRRSVRERDAAVALLSKPATDEETAGELVSGAALAYQRRDAAERALLANRGDDLVAPGIVSSTSNRSRRGSRRTRTGGRLLRLSPVRHAAVALLSKPATDEETAGDCWTRPTPTRSRRLRLCHSWGVDRKIRPPSDSSARSCRSFLQSRRCAMPWSTRCASSSAVAGILASRTS